MKPRLWPTLFGFVSIVALAAEEAPPAEVLQNLDFYQNMNMVQDQQFFAVATQKAEPAQATAHLEALAISSTTIHAKENTDASK